MAFYLTSKSPNLNTNMDKIKKIYRQCATIPRPTKAYLCKKSPHTYGLRVNWTHKDVDLAESVAYCKYYSLHIDQSSSTIKVEGSSDLMNISNELASSVSPNGTRKAVITKCCKSGETKIINQMMEIWNDKGKLTTINIEKDKVHGKIHLFAGYSCLEWSPNETSLLYLAETLTKGKPFFKESKYEKSSEEEGEEYVWQEGWGEQLEGLNHSCVCVLDTLNSDYKPRVIEQQGITFAEPFWINEDKIGFIGWKEEPRRLGLMFCPIRPNCLYTLDLKNPNSKLEVLYGHDKKIAISSPRLNPDGKSLAMLVRKIGGSHFKRANLVVLDLKSTQEVVLFDTNKPNNLNDTTNFTSLYTQSLPLKCWINNHSLVLTCKIGVGSYIYLVDVSSKSVQKLTSPYETVDVLSYLDDILVVSSSNPCTSLNVFVAKLNKNNEELKYTEVEPNWTVKEQDLTYKLDQIKIQDEKGAEKFLTSILISPKHLLNKPGPVVLIIHGGPHSVSSCNFNQERLFYAKFDLKLILVNYRGSCGVGDDYLNSLCGKIGTNDVQDVLSCLRYYQSCNEVDNNQISLIGGSHGGFLVTSLIALDNLNIKFKACVASNPVVDIATNVGMTDIPDWCWTEAIGLNSVYNNRLIPDGKDLTIMMTKSPIHNLDKVTTPTLLLLGSQDQRVPYLQGLNYHRGLKARNVPTRCLVYEDNHSLQNIPHDIDSTINTLTWILHYIDK